jgi:hypothetical protein
VREVGELVKPVGGDANLLGGGRDGARESFQAALPFVEGRVLFTGVVSEKGDGS